MDNPLADMTDLELLTQYALEDTKRERSNDPERLSAYGTELCQRGYLVTSGPRYASEDEVIDVRYPRKTFEATNFGSGKPPIAVNERGERVESSYK